MKKAKKILFLFVLCCIAVSMTACSDNADEESENEVATTASAPMFETSLIQTQVSTTAAATTTTSDTTESTTETTEETTSSSEETTTTLEMTTTETTTTETTTESTTTTEETTTTETTSTTTTADIATAPETAPVLTTETVTVGQTFAPGIWWSTSSDGDRYFSFNAVGTEGSFRDQESGIGLGFSYEAEGNTLTFHMGDAGNSVQATVAFTDSRTAVLTWADSSTETLTYQGLGNFDTFRFYSNLELCEMALDYYEARNHYRPGDAAAAVQSDGTIVIQLYDNMTDHNATSAWYTVDRFSAQGTDMLGNAVNLTES